MTGNFIKTVSVSSKQKRNAPSVSWKEHCNEVENTNESARLRKILAKDPIPLGSLKDSSGHWTESSSETLETLIRAHFPGCILDTNNIQEERSLIEHTLPPDVITEQKIKWAIGSFSPYKSPGLDGIFPKMLQECDHYSILLLKKIFESILKWSYIPKIWREVKVVFIPKAGKPSHTNAKDFRPISLTSFMLKTFERLIDIHIRSTLPQGVLSPAQHAYTKGKSVETALHSVVSTIEKSLEDKEYTLAAFLDIEGAFNNVQNEAVKSALVELGVDKAIIGCIICMLQNRLINSELGGSRIRVSTSRGTPQGGVLSPLIWLLVLNVILNKLKHSGVKVVAYADDLALLATGKFLSTLSELLEFALLMVCTWARSCGLAVNPVKTELVLFTNKRKIPNFKLPSIDGTQLSISDSAKYLGVILDKKLNWNLNIKERAHKAMFALYSCNRIFGKTWGPNPKIIMWMYTAIVRPILTYGCLVWWKAMEKATNLNTLTKVQRMACISVTGAMRTTPTAGLEAILNLKPLDLFVQELAVKSALRLSQTSVWKQSQVGHSQILNRYVGNNVCTDYITPQQDFDCPFTSCIPSRQEWESNHPLSNDSTITIFTDGSKMECGIGAGFYSETLGLASSFRLPDHSSVFQAEVLAVTKAAERLSALVLQPSVITFFVDSQAAIKAISAAEIKSKLVSCCREELKVLSAQHCIRLCWVPGHMGIPGNERADELARIGSSMDPNQAERSIHAPICSLKQIAAKKTLEKTNVRWTLLDTCANTKKLWPCFDRGKTERILMLNKRSLHSLVSIITGHNLLKYHKKKLGLSTDDLCRGCGDEEVYEDSAHFLCHCPALAHLRNKYLGNYFFNDLEELSDLSCANLSKFINASKWLENT